MKTRSLLLIMLAGSAAYGCAAPSQLSHTDRDRIFHRTFVVTGASSGFGRGVAVKLGQHGANVVLAARRGEVLNEVADEVRAVGGVPLVVPIDVSKQEDMARLAQATVTRFGRIDVWINNAAVGVIGRFEEIPVEDHARVIDINVKGVIYGSYAALQQFVRQGHGTLINIGSVESKVPLAYHASYSASKHAVLGLTQALSQELRLAGRKSIKVVTVMPWATDTPFWQHAANYSGHSPRMVLMDGPEKVVDTIIYTAIHPRKRVSVGWKAEAVAIGDHIAPGLTEHIAADIAHDAQIKDAPPAPAISGSLYRPVPEGTGVRGGARERIKAEDRAREQQR